MHRHAPSPVPTRSVLTAPPPPPSDAVRPTSAETPDVPCDASACTRARHWATRQLAELDVRWSDVREDADLIVTELVSNAVLHGAAPIVVCVSHSATVIDVSVTDGGAPPYLFGSLPRAATATHGRGLAIVATLTPTWGVRALHPGPGKTVWCRLRGPASDG